MVETIDCNAEWVKIQKAKLESLKKQKALIDSGISNLEEDIKKYEGAK